MVMGSGRFLGGGIGVGPASGCIGGGTEEAEVSRSPKERERRSVDGDLGGIRRWAGGVFGGTMA